MPRYRPKAQVKANLDLWLNNTFLTDGFFSTVSTNETDVYGRDISLLSAVSDESFADGRVYQSAFKNWVHESGISPTNGVAPPLIASGVTVNGTFYPQYSGAFGYSAAFAHAFDFPNGRVIFNSPIAANSTVKAQFSYKEIAVDYANIFENETREFYFETAYKDNPYQTGVITYPLANSRTLPMVMIDVDSSKLEPYEIGSSAAIVKFDCVLHLWARDGYMMDQIEDLLAQERTTLLGIDFNRAPQPLTYIGDKNGSFTSYGSLAVENGTYFWRRIYIDDISTRKVNPFYNMERSQIRFTVNIYPNF